MWASKTKQEPRNSLSRYITLLHQECFQIFCRFKIYQFPRALDLQGGHLCDKKTHLLLSSNFWFAAVCTVILNPHRKGLTGKTRGSTLPSDPACTGVRLLYRPIARQQTSHALFSAACSSVEPRQHRQLWKLLQAIYGQTEPGRAQHPPHTHLHRCCREN